jgi:hypothetical protein
MKSESEIKAHILRLKNLLFEAEELRDDLGERALAIIRDEVNGKLSTLAWVLE